MENFDDNAADAALAMELDEAIDRRMMEALYRLVEAHPQKFVNLFEKAKENVAAQQQQRSFERLRLQVEQQLNAMRQEVYQSTTGRIVDNTAKMSSLGQYQSVIGLGTAADLQQVYANQQATITNTIYNRGNQS